MGLFGKMRWVSVVVLLVMVGEVRGELWWPLRLYAEQCVLILKVKVVGKVAGDERDWNFEVEETWKGKYDRAVFVRSPPEGGVVLTVGEHGMNVKEGQEAIVFFTEANQPEKGKLDRHSTAFPVREGKIEYASTSDNPEIRAEMTVEEFHRRIVEATTTRPSTRPSP